MLNQPKDDLLAAYRHAFQDLTLILAGSLGPTLGARVADLGKALRDYETQVTQLDVVQKLTGQGPLASLRGALDLPSVHPSNLLTLWPEEQRVTFAHLATLTKDFLSNTQTGYTEGGEVLLNVRTAPELPASLDDLSSGVYRISDAVRPRPALCVTVPGTVLSQLIIALPTCPHTGKPTFKVSTYVPSEKQWVTHDHFEVMSQKALRSAWLSLMTRLGGRSVTQRVSISELYNALNTYFKQPGRGESLELTFQGYRLHTTPPVEDTLIYTPDGHPVEWSNLSVAKQQQLHQTIQSL